MAKLQCSNSVVYVEVKYKCNTSARKAGLAVEISGYLVLTMAVYGTRMHWRIVVFGVITYGLCPVVSRRTCQQGIYRR